MTGAIESGTLVERMARRYSFGLTDLTPVQTIYRVHFQTARLKVDRKLVGSRSFELTTLVKSPFLKPILDAIFETLEDDQEHILILILNAAHEMRGFKILASGAQDHIWLDRKILFRNALLLGAKSIILVHNHPSGSLAPSPHDIKLTKLLTRGGRLLDIDIIDHVIYTPDDVLSLREQKPELFKEEDELEDEDG
jgi:hypothetical protein